MKEPVEENKKVKNSRSYFWPLLLIIIGLLFLLNNLELIPWTIWNTLIRFWPLILILTGLEILLGRSRMANLIVTLIGLLILILIVAIYIPETHLLLLQYMSQINFTLIR